MALAVSLHGSLVGSLLIAWVVAPCPVKATTPADWFNEAVRMDLSGAAPQKAFELYHRAADAQLPAAEFDVAVMLDSGRGVAANPTEAALWYARAATHGSSRAAYNLGLLYSNGEGVPINTDLARAWFEASGLRSAREHVKTLRSGAALGAMLSAPVLGIPSFGPSQDDAGHGVELVWTSEQQPEPARFFVEVRAIETSSSSEVFSGFVGTSAVFLPLPEGQKHFAWRVITVASRLSHYAASEWASFSVFE